MGAASAKPEAPPAAVEDGSAKLVDWTGSVRRENDAPADPRMLNDVTPDDPLEGIDFQMVPLRIVEALRKKHETMNIDQCRMQQEEFVTCMKEVQSSMRSCNPLFQIYGNCLREWRDSNQDEYYKLVKDMAEGKLLEKWQRRQRLIEEEWKRKFPDDPMPRAHKPTLRPVPKDAETYYLHEKDRDLVKRDLAIQRLEEIDAAQRGISVEELRAMARTTDATTIPDKKWRPAF